jgi:hypothetical protein
MREYYAFDGHGFQEQRHLACWFINDPGLGRAWLILDGAVAVGYVVLCLTTAGWLRQDAFVDELCWRNIVGAAGAARRGVLKNGRKGGEVRTLHLEVVRQNTAALEISEVGIRETRSTFLSNGLRKILQTAKWSRL